METIVINEDGSFLWTDPQIKLDKLKQDVEPKLREISLRYERNESSQYPRKLNYNTQITTILMNSLSQFKNIPNIYVNGMSAETFRDYIIKFREMVSWVLEFYPDYVCSKEQFNAFMGITFSAYNDLLNSSNPDILCEAERLEGFLGELQLVSAQTGIFKEKTTETRLRADGIGHNLNLRPDVQSITVNNNYKLGAEEVNKRLQSILGGKFLENKKK